MSPIPATVSLELAFLPGHLSKEAYRKEVKQIIRKWLIKSHLRRDERASLFEEYDEEINRIIKEVVLEN